MDLLLYIKALAKRLARRPCKLQCLKEESLRQRLSLEELQRLQHWKKICRGCVSRRLHLLHTRQLALRPQEHTPIQARNTLRVWEVQLLGQ